MSDKQMQVAKQCKVVAHLATALAQVHAEYASYIGSAHPGDAFLDLVGSRTARWMETLGDMLNGIDAASEEDDWVAPIFAEAHRLFPAPPSEDGTP